MGFYRYFNDCRLFTHCTLFCMLLCLSHMFIKIYLIHRYVKTILLKLMNYYPSIIYKLLEHKKCEKKN